MVQSVTREVATITLFNESCLQETVQDRYNRCGLLNLIQHIDIFGKFRASYDEHHKPCCDAFVCISSTSSSSKKKSTSSSLSSIRNVESKLSRFSIATKVSGLYPGHDILGRKARRKRSSRSNVMFEEFVPK